MMHKHTMDQRNKNKSSPHSVLRVNLFHAMCTDIDTHASQMKLTMLHDADSILHNDQHVFRVPTFEIDSDGVLHTQSQRNILQDESTNDAAPLTTRDTDSPHELILPYDYALVGTGSRQNHSFIRYSPYLHHYAPQEDMAQVDFNILGRERRSTSEGKSPIFEQDFTLVNTEQRIDAMRRFQHLVRDSEDIMVIGAGGIGTELVGELVDMIKPTDRKHISLAHSGHKILPAFPKDASDYAKQFMQAQKVQLFTDLRMEFKYSPEPNEAGRHFSTSSGNCIVDPDPNTFVVPTTGMIPNTEFLPPNMLDKRGFMFVNQHLQSLHHGNVFGAGDMTVYDHTTAKKMPLEFKKATTANNQAKTATQNILRLIDGEDSLLVHKPKKFRYDISLGKYDGFVVTPAGIKSSGLTSALLRRFKFSRKMRMKMGMGMWYTHEKIAAATLVMIVIVGASMVLASWIRVQSGDALGDDAEGNIQALAHKSDPKQV